MQWITLEETSSAYVSVDVIIIGYCRGMYAVFDSQLMQMLFEINDDHLQLVRRIGNLCCWPYNMETLPKYLLN